MVKVQKPNSVPSPSLIQKHDIDLPPLMVMVIEGRGGVGKSLMSSTSIEALGLADETVHVLDCDSTNSSMSMIHNAHLVNVRDVRFEGELLYAAERLRSGDFRHIVLDAGARDEVHIKPHLAALARELRSFGGRLVVVRPVTLSHFVQQNAISFVTETKTDDIGVVFVCNLGQGRKLEDFREWKSTLAHADMMRRGVIEVHLEDAGARYSDQATSCGLSLADVALGRFEKAGEDADTARTVFERPDQLFLSRWLYRQTETFRRAFADCIA